MTSAVRGSDFAQLFMTREAGAVRKECKDLTTFEAQLVQFSTCMSPLIEATALQCRVLTAQLNARRSA